VIIQTITATAPATGTSWVCLRVPANVTIKYIQGKNVTRGGNRMVFFLAPTSITWDPTISAPASLPPALVLQNAVQGSENDDVLFSGDAKTNQTNAQVIGYFYDSATNDILILTVGFVP